MFNLLSIFASGDALKSHQVKILGAKPQSNIELEEKADKDELDIMDMNIRLLWIWTLAYYEYINIKYYGYEH